MEKNYYNEIESFIKKNEINKKRRVLEENYDTLNNFWNIGKLLVEAQGGEKRAKYGNELIKKWSLEYTKNYGKGYDATNLRRFRQFYLEFSKCGPLGHKLSWTNIRVVLPIKDINKRNYYINLCIEKNLSKRELIREIRSNSYERLIDKPDKIEIIQPKEKFLITKQIKNPIILEVKNNKEIKSEKDLEVLILSQLSFFFSQLGEGFAFIETEYKIKNQRIDMLLFNIKLNCYFVIELKLRKLKSEDKGQVEMYMDLIDKYVKEAHHNKTMGIIITKEQDKLIANFVASETLIPLTYELK